MDAASNNSVDDIRELRESGKFDSEKLPWEYRPHALFVAYAPFDSPRYALSVVVEHGNAAAAVAAGPPRLFCP